MMKLLRFFSRIIVGLVFIFSGFVKAVDPYGSAYKFEDYFTAFGMEWLHFFCLPLSFILSGAEFLIGISMFFAIRIRIGSWASTLFMVFFAILTLFLAIYDPVTDCGCFGDAFILTNWETFFKNLIFVVPTIFVFISLKKFHVLLNQRLEWLIIAFFGLFILTISINGYIHLPLFDFRPYNTGVYIPDGMEIPEGVPQDEYESILIYEKDGVQKEFTTDNYPWEDSTWVFIDAKHILINKGYEPPIHDFSIETQEGDDITDIVLYDDNFTFLFIAYDLTKSKKINIEKINKIALYAINNGYSFIGLTSSLYEEIVTFSSNNNITDFEFCNTDEITLKTIIRSNPGLVLLKDGIIIEKWHYNDIPDIEEFGNNLLSYKLTSSANESHKLKLYNILWLSLLLIVLFKVLINYTKRKQNKLN